MRKPVKIFLFLLLSIFYKSASADFEGDFTTKYAPYLASQSLAFDKVKQIIASLPAEDRSMVERKIAFAMRSPIHREHCATSFQLAGVETVPGRKDGLMFLFVCRRNIINAANAVTTAAILNHVSMPSNEENGEQKLLDIIFNSIDTSARLSVRDYDYARNGSDAGTTCIPTYRAYVFLNGYDINDCWKFTNPSIVRDLMWPRVRDAARLGFEYDDLEDTKNYWALGESLTEAVIEKIFQLVVLHELGHIINGDLNRKGDPKAMEIKADAYAKRFLGGNDKLAHAGIAYLNLLVVGYVASSMEQFYGRDLMKEPIANRFLEHTVEYGCSISSSVDEIDNVEIRNRTKERLKNTSLPDNCAKKLH